MDPELEAEARSDLVALPKVSDDLQALNPAIQAIFGSNKTAKMLASNNFKGIFVRLPQQSVVKRDPQGKEVTEKISLGCIYIPAPNFDRIVVIKTVNDISRSNSLSIVGESVEHQVTYINDLLSQIKANSTSSSDRTLLQFLISSPTKVTKSKEYKELKSSLHSIVAPYNVLQQVKVEMEFINEKKIKTEVEKTLKKFIAKRGGCFELVNYFGKMNQVEGYQLKTEKLKFLNSEPSTVSDVDKAIKMFEFFFPERFEKFYTVPELNQLEENILYSTTEEGELGNLAEYGAYMGEIKLFSEQLLNQHQELTGVFLKSFTNKHLQSIIDIDYLKPENFEFDWVYLGSDKIVVFEVGLSRTPSEPWQMMENKIFQGLTKHIPQMQAILHSFQKAFGIDDAIDSDLFTKILNEELIFCIYFPEMKEEICIKEVEQIKNSLTSNGQVDKDKKKSYSQEFLNLLATQKHNLTEKTFFLVEENNSNCLKLMKINAQFHLTDSDITLQNLFAVGPSSPHDKLLKYACSLLTIASLNYLELTDGDRIDRSPMDVDNRYRKSFVKWLKNKKVNKEGLFLNETFNLILSPQQHRILKEIEKTHLIITGQPGSGKTTLLLEKCEQMSSRGKVDKILFLYDGNKTLFRNYLDKLVGTNCSEAMRRKLTVSDIQSASLGEMRNKGSKEVMTSAEVIFFT